jgi:cytochrome c2
VRQSKHNKQRTTKLFCLMATCSCIALIAGAIVYARNVARAPWRVEQQRFYAVELALARRSVAREEAEFAARRRTEYDKLTARKQALEASRQPGGAFANAEAAYKDLSQAYDEVEQQGKVAQSRLTEAQRERKLAEDRRDQAITAAKEASRNAPHAANAAEGMVSDQPSAKAELPQGHEENAEISIEKDRLANLVSEREWDRKEAEALRDVSNSIEPPLRPLFGVAEQMLRETAVKVEVEISWRVAMLAAKATLAAIDGPPDPARDGKGAQAVGAARMEACAKWANGALNRHCLEWSQLSPVTDEMSSLDRAIRELERPVTDSQQRLASDERRSRLAFWPSPFNLADSLLGDYMVHLVPSNWSQSTSGVDKSRVDRCPTCHMGVASPKYTEPIVPREFRTHPFRSTLLVSHPVETFGCTSCHQGDGAATDFTAHSGARADALLHIGTLVRTVIDDRNDELRLKVDAKEVSGEWTTVNIGAGAGASKEYATESELFDSLQNASQRALAPSIQKSWRVIVRRLDCRVTIGLDRVDSDEPPNETDKPTLRLDFTKPALAELLGFNAVLYEHASTYTAERPPSAPVRSSAEESWNVSPDSCGTCHYSPPKGRKGLSIPPEYLARFTLALPEVEAGCAGCHARDTDLRPRISTAQRVYSKLERLRSEAENQTVNQSEQEQKTGPASAQDPVPVYSEGRRLFRRLNCTGCHSLDGYPGNRDAGPPLDSITSKTTPGWILKWLRDPRAWLHKARMPNFWPAPIDAVSKKPFPVESPQYVTWEKRMKEETLAIAAFLTQQSEGLETSSNNGSTGGVGGLVAGRIEGYSKVAGASAEEGRRLFDSYGCLGCHRSEFRSERDVAPDLLNASGKLKADWIAYWAEAPSRYWPGARMPNLRLSRRDAASIAKMLVTLKNEPEDTPAVSETEVAILTNPAQRQGEISCSVADAERLSRVDCGARLIAYYGCFGCHRIGGFESAAPVGPDLNGWATKDPANLEFGRTLNDQKKTREAFTLWKLDAPRLFERDDIKLKMGDYDLSPREIRALTIFLLGLTNRKPKTKFDPYEVPSYVAAVDGRQIVEDYNCRGCHVIEGWGGNLRVPSSDLGDEFPPELTGEGARVQPEWLSAFLRDPATHGVRPPLHPEWVWGDDVPADRLAYRMPTFPFSAQQVTAVVNYFANRDDVPTASMAKWSPFLTPEAQMAALIHINGSADQGENCVACHFVGEFPIARGRVELDRMGPNLGEVYKRLRPEWTKFALGDPFDLLPNSRMPGFWPDPCGEPLHWTLPSGFQQPRTVGQQVDLIRDYIYLFREHTKLPAPGEEGRTPVLGLDEGGPDGTANGMKSSRTARGG